MPTPRGDNLHPLIKRPSNALCLSLVLTAKCLSSCSPCHLIALDTNPGVRPISIEVTPRHIIAKAAYSVTKSDILDAAGSAQLGAGQTAEAEAAVHAVNECFQQDDNEAIPLVDASNAFNPLNCSVALHNICSECPAISTILINTYREPPELFIDGEVIYS